MNETKWSSFDPLSIPQEIRKEQLNKGNIVANSFFNKGLPSSAKEATADFTLEDWTVIGNNVEWVDEPGRDRVIKITRDKVNETESNGEGVESNFIPVIPGNYQFTYNVKLKDIYPNRARFGTKLYDAIDIRVMFYDAYKQAIDSKIKHPHYKIDMDNSFKGFSFSNFWHIENFGWENVVARTFNYPFSEGDIPDNCRYVKLFLGLKGNGTMWVDNVEFKFSRWNFTALEKLSPYIDADFSSEDLLIPTPKQIGNIERVEFSSDPNMKPLIIIPKRSDSATINAAETLREQFEISVGIDVETLTEISGEQLDSGRLIFSIGDTSLLQENRFQLPFAEIDGKDQGYFIRRLSHLPNVIYLAGNRGVGNFYAVTTAVQLFNKNVFNYADIIDYPDFTGRSFILKGVKEEDDIKHNLEDIKRMSVLKLNKVYSGYGDHGKDWQTPSQLFLDGLKEAGRKCKEIAVVDMAAQFNPYFQFEYEMHVPNIPEKLKNYWLHSRPKDMEKLKERIRYYFECGANCLMLLADDFVPHEEDYRKLYSLWTKEDKDRFVNLQNAQAFMINEVYNMLKEEFPGSRMEFCPPWYLNEFIDRSRGYAEQYFRDLIAQIPEDIAIIWTGNTVRSLSFDMADIERYRELIGRYPMLFDNTLYARRLDGSYGGYPGLYPGKVRMCNIFEPYDVHLPKDFHKYNDGGHIYQNGGSCLEYQKIKYMTVADYEWNTGSYNPDFSLWKALYTQFGKDTSLKLLEFNDNYYGAVDMQMRIDREGKQEKYLKKASEYKHIAETILAELKQTSAVNNKLIEELQDWLDKLNKEEKE